MDAHNGLLTGTEARRYALAGNARLTLVSRRTGNRFTYKIKAAKDEDGKPKGFFFVSVLTSPDNVDGYTYLGTISGDRFRHGVKSPIGLDAPSARAFVWGWERLEGHADLEVYHDGSCGRCGRLLTVPSSVLSGIGPECALRLVA